MSRTSIDRNLPTIGCTARNNPFATHCVEALAFQFADGDWQSQLTRLRQMGFRGSIVGPQGSGKTTLLLELKDQLAINVCEPDQIEFSFVSQTSKERANQLLHLEAALSRQQILLIDGFERFSWGQRRRLRKRRKSTGSIVVTTHRRCGLPVWVQCDPNIQLLGKLLGQLGHPHDESLYKLAGEYFFHRKGNIRETFRDLYDEWGTHRGQQSS